jgi:hypothetical protein
MKHLLAVLFLIGSSTTLLAQDIQKPDWVKLYQQGKAFPDTMDCYFGIGSSLASQDLADIKARQEFALNIEARVHHEITHNVEEVDNVLRDEYSATAKLSSDVVLRGISISGRYVDFDLRQYYAIIQIRKSVFDTLLVAEIRRDVERKKAENRANEEKMGEELRSRQADLELRRKEEETRKQELEAERKQYEDFLSLKAPEQVIDLRNGEISRKGYTVGIKTALSPFDVQSAYINLAMWRFELSANAYFQSEQFLKDNMLDREQASFKIQLLEQAGEFYKTSLAFGVVGYAEVSTLESLDSTRPRYSLFVGGDVGLPTVLSSFASIYMDGRKFSVGWNCFPVPGKFKDGVCLLVQLDYVWTKEWRNRFSDPFLFQTGIRFRASDAFATSFTYEGHEFLVFSIEMGF